MSEDWLPHEPPAPAAPKSSAKRTFVIWAVLLCVFVALYTMMSSSEPGDVDVVVAGYSGWWIWLAALVGAAAPFAFLMYLFSGHKRFNTLQAPALEALADRRYGRAAELFGEVARRYRAKPTHAAAASYNRGYALLRGGDSAAAVGVLLGVERTIEIGPGGVRQLAVTQLVRAFTIGGDLEKASRWLEVARGRTGALADPVHDKAIRDAVECLLLCRQGRVDDALRHYQECWARLEATLPVRQMEEAWLMRAFAIASTSTPRDNAAVEPWLRLLRSVPPGSLDWLTAQWPELATFTVTHGLRATPAAA